MPITSVSETIVVQKCQRCSGENRLSIGDLRLGTDEHPDHIELTPCAVCGVIETLYACRTPSSELEKLAANAEEGSVDVHNVLVRTLGAALQRLGKTATVYINQDPVTAVAYTDQDQMKKLGKRARGVR